MDDLNNLQDRLRQLELLVRSIDTSPPPAPAPKAKDHTLDVIKLQAELGDLRRELAATRKAIPSTANLISLEAWKAGMEQVADEIYALHKEQKALVKATAAQAAESAELAKSVAASTARSARDQLMNRVQQFAR